MNRSITVACTEAQARAGARTIRALIHHPHPMVARAIREALNDLSWSVLVAFTESCEAALLAESIPPEPRPAHLSEMRDQFDGQGRD